jgi:hypothetical protein
MIYGYHLTICLQSCVDSRPFCWRQSADLPYLYDLLAPFVIYLGIYRPSAGGDSDALVLAGLVMDGISGGVFGVHLSAYLWMYVGVRWAIQYLHVDNVILLPLLVTGGVFFREPGGGLLRGGAGFGTLAGGVHVSGCFRAGTLGGTDGSPAGAALHSRTEIR